MGLPWKGLRRFLDLQTQLSKSLEEMIELVKENIHEQVYTKDEILRELEVTPDELLETSLSVNTAHCKYK